MAQMQVLAQRVLTFLRSFYACSQKYKKVWHFLRKTLDIAYCMSIQPNASLTKIGLAAPVSTTVGIALNVAFYLHLNQAERKKRHEIA